MADPTDELLARAQALARAEGRNATAWPALEVVRASSPAARMPALYEPGLVFVLQGRKVALLGAQRLVYDPMHYLAVSLTSLPLAQITEASPAAPYLCLRLAVAPQEIAALAAQAGPAAARGPARVLQVARMTEPLHDALRRLLRLLETPADLPVLAPLVVREICWRALSGDVGPGLRALAVADSHAARVARAIELLKARFDEPLRIADLAAVAHMSPSSLHHHFRQLTTMSPLQYQKQLRLHQARALMLSGGLDAATAAHRVGYESPSQFGREYRRLFGAPPRAEVQALKAEQVAAD